MNLSLVIPVPLVSARAWACGWIHDIDLMLGPSPAGEALYVSTLPDIRAWRTVLPSLIQQGKGVSALILRTDTPAVVHHVTKWGAVPTYQDPSGRLRYWCGPAVVRRYFGRMPQNSAACSGVTSSR